ncbi:MAG: thioredoxin domain-containing protein [Caulobacterales bacterium]|jgi:protein-disulfide isomerase
MSILRRTVLAAALMGAAALAACQPKAAAPAPAEGLYVLGKADAPITLIEYASVTCSHCKNFHDDVMPMLKTDFIDSGKVRYEFRPMRSAPINLSTAAFLMAACNNPSPAQYQQRVSVLFQQQGQLFQSPNPVDTFTTIAQSVGLTPEQFTACIRDEAAAKAMEANEKALFEKYPTFKGTPSFLLNGKPYDSINFANETGRFEAVKVKAALEAELAKLK